jgi:RNA polymerase sigma-70 factor (ECF subfamily)
MNFLSHASSIAENQPDFMQSLLAELDALYRTARYLLRDPTLAEDMVQEVAFKAIHGQNTFRKGANFRPWVFSILRHAVADYYRQQRVTQPVFSLEDHEFEIPDDGSVERDFLDQVMDDEIIRALSELPEEMRLAVLLADVEGFSYEEIARVLNWPKGSVMSRLSRGRQKLRTLLRCYAEHKGYSR